MADDAPRDPDSEPREERRHHSRRAADTDEFPAVRPLIASGKVASAIGAICLLIGGAISAIAFSVRAADSVQAQTTRIAAQSHRIDIVTARQDSMLTAIQAISRDVALQSYIQCVTLRRAAPDLRPAGCDAAERKGKP